MSAIAEHRCGSVRLSNVYKHGAEIRYLTNLRNCASSAIPPQRKQAAGTAARKSVREVFMYRYAPSVNMVLMHRRAFSITSGVRLISSPPVPSTH